MTLSRPDLIATYREKTPLRHKDKLRKEHIDKLETCQRPSEVYDRLIEEARRVYTRKKASGILKSRPVPLSFEDQPSAWRARKPDKIDISLLVQDCWDRDKLIKAKEYAMKPDLSREDFYQLAHILFSTPDIPFPD